MLVGYMRVSTDGDRQVMDLQRDALLAAGVDERHLFEDRASGSHDDRAGLAKALAFLKPSDCLVVWKLDRLGRSLSHLPRDGKRAERSRGRIPVADRADGHHYPTRRIPVPCLRRAGAIRALVD